MPKQDRRQPNRNITRMDYARTRGYWVRFEGAHPVSRMFSDGVYGGKTKALAEARKFRDAWELTHDLTRRMGPQSLPGPGRIVRRQVWQRKSWSWVWEAYIRLERGKGHAVTRYSIAKWGSSEAKRLCEVWLKQKRKEQAEAYGPTLVAKPAPPPKAKVSKKASAKVGKASAKSATSKVSAAKVSAAKVSAAKVSAAKVSAAKVSAAKASTAKVSTKVGPRRSKAA